MYLNSMGILSIISIPQIIRDDHEINFIHIGDTRHIAMINLIAEGASPVTAMLLAGHDNITTSSHYFQI